LYRLVRVELKSLYDLLPTKEREKYYGYFVAVTEYEKKIAEGVYNPDLDGVLSFDYVNKCYNYANFGLKGNLIVRVKLSWYRLQNFVKESIHVIHAVDIWVWQ